MQAPGGETNPAGPPSDRRDLQHGEPFARTNEPSLGHQGLPMPSVVMALDALLPDIREIVRRIVRSPKMLVAQGGIVKMAGWPSTPGFCLWDPFFSQLLSENRSRLEAPIHRLGPAHVFL